MSSMPTSVSWAASNDLPPYIGLTAVNGNLLGETVAADDFLQTPERRLFISVFHEPTVDHLTMFIHRAIIHYLPEW